MEPPLYGAGSFQYPKQHQLSVIPNRGVYHQSPMDSNELIPVQSLAGITPSVMYMSPPGQGQGYPSSSSTVHASYVTPTQSGDTTSQSLLTMEQRQSTTEIRLQLTQINGKLDRIVERVESPSGVRRSPMTVNRFESPGPMDELMTYSSVSKMIQDSQRTVIHLDQRVAHIDILVENVARLLAENKRQLEKIGEAPVARQGRELFAEGNGIGETSATKLAEVELDAIRLEMRTLRDDLNSKEKINVDLMQQLEKSKASEYRNRTEAEMHKDRITDYESIIDCLRGELREERLSRMKHENSEGRLLADLEETRTKKECLEASLAELRTKTRQEMTSHNEELRSANDKHEQDISQLKETFRREKRQLEADLLQKTRHIEEEMNHTWEERNSRHLVRMSSKHANDLKELEDDNVRLRARLEALQQKLAATKTREQIQVKKLEEVADLLERAEKWENKYNNLRMKAMEMKEHYEEQIATSKTKMMQLEQRLNTVIEETVRKYERQLEEMNESNAKRTIQLSEELMSAKRRHAELESTIGQQQLVIHDLEIAHHAAMATVTTTCLHDDGKFSFTADNDAGNNHGRQLSIDVTKGLICDVKRSSDGMTPNQVGIDSNTDQLETVVHETSNGDDDDNSSDSGDEDYVTVADGSSTIDGRDDDIDDDDIDDVIHEFDIHDVTNDRSYPGEEEAMNLIEMPDTVGLLSPMLTRSDLYAETSDVEDRRSRPVDSEYCVMSTIAQYDDSRQHHSDDVFSADHRYDDVTIVNRTTSVAGEKTLHKTSDDDNYTPDVGEIESSSVLAFQETTHSENDVENNLIVEDDADVEVTEQVGDVPSPEDCDNTSDKHHPNLINPIADMFQAGTDECFMSVLTTDDVTVISGVVGSQPLVDADFQMSPAARDDVDNKLETINATSTIGQELTDVDEMNSVVTETRSYVENAPIETSRDVSPSTFQTTVYVEPQRRTPDDVTEGMSHVTFLSRDGCVIEPPPFDDENTDALTLLRNDLIISSNTTLDTTSSNAGAMVTAKTHGGKKVASIFDTDSDDDDDALFAVIGRSRPFQ